jgi:hypothetical protein
MSGAGTRSIKVSRETSWIALQSSPWEKKKPRQFKLIIRAPKVHSILIEIFYAPLPIPNSSQFEFTWASIKDGLMMAQSL